MTIKWDPTIVGVISSKDLEQARANAREAQNTEVRGPKAPPPGPDSEHPSPPPTRGLPPPEKTSSGQNLWKNELERLKTALKRDPEAQGESIEAASRLALSYRTRRMKAARRDSNQLLGMILKMEGTHTDSVQSLQDILLAESELNELSPDNTWNAARLLMSHIHSEDPHHALAQATLARTFTQLALHFPAELDQEELPIHHVLEQAFYLAESAATEAPGLADATTALGRLVLVHPEEEACSDSEELFRLALSQDPEFDPARLGLAAALSLQNRGDEALHELGLLAQRGNTFPGRLVLRAQLRAKRGDLRLALEDINRATRLAPRAGLFRVDAAQISHQAGQHERAERFMAEAHDLLGPYASQALSATSDSPRG